MGDKRSIVFYSSGFITPAHLSTTMKHLAKFKSRHIQLTIGLVLIDLIYFSDTSATDSKPLIIFTGFILIGLTFYAFINGIMKFLSLYGIKIRQISRFSAFISIFLIIILALQSIGELSIKDVLVLLPITLITYVYSSYFKKASRQIQ